jgi:hypothetical protein
MQRCSHRLTLLRQSWTIQNTIHLWYREQLLEAHNHVEARYIYARIHLNQRNGYILYARPLSVHVFELRGKELHCPPFFDRDCTDIKFPKADM